MGITPPSLMAAFRDKRGLFDAAVARYVETIAAKHLTALEGADDLRERLAAFFDAIIADASGDGHPTGCLVTCGLADMAGDDAASERTACHAGGGRGRVNDASVRRCRLRSQGGAWPRPNRSGDDA
jgi:AcrR family transcriptional regulator